MHNIILIHTYIYIYSLLELNEYILSYSQYFNFRYFIRKIVDEYKIKYFRAFTSVSAKIPSDLSIRIFCLLYIFNIFYIYFSQYSTLDYLFYTILFYYDINLFFIF